MTQDYRNKGQLKLGINGFGRIGKLTVWNHVGRKYFDELVVNIGRNAGSGCTTSRTTWKGIPPTAP